MATINIGSLFAGIGGFDLAFRNANATIAWHSETDTQASTVLTKHWPDVPNLGDITDLNNPPYVDVLCGGFPCQDVSIAGKRKGFQGDRSSLWHDYARIIGQVRPRWVVVENTPGLFTTNNGRDFGTILRDLDKFGYLGAWRTLDSQWFGVAQRRRRVFIIGNLGNENLARTVLFEPSCVSGDTRPSRETGQNVASALTASALGGGGPDDNTAQARHLIPETVVGSRVRKLTPLECERLQGFPDHWTAGQADTHRYRQLGNAVTVPVAEWIANRITEAHARSANILATAV